MKWLLFISLLIPFYGYSQDAWDLHKSVFATTGKTSIQVKAEPVDRDLEIAAKQLHGEHEGGYTGCTDCIPSVLTDPVLDLISDIENIITDDMMMEVDAPQAVVNKALAKSKQLVCAEIEMFARVHKLNVDISCIKVPQVIPPIHMQVIKFPGLFEAKQKLEAEIETYRERLKANPQDFTADSLIRRRTQDLECITNPNPKKYSCVDFLRVNFSTKAVIQIEIQDRSGQWYEFKHMPVDYFSGIAGPKTKQGDFQVPESRYRLTGVNPGSQYFSAVHIDYENWTQRKTLLGELDVPVSNKGGDIKIHGHGGSVGCLDMGNRGAAWMSAIVDLSLKKGRVPEIDIYPTDMDEGLEEVSSWEGYQRYDKFWAELKKRYWDKHGTSVRRDLTRVDQMVAEAEEEKE